MPTFATGLGGVPRVNLDHRDPFLLCFVGEEGVKLCEAPRMETTLCFCLLLHLGTPTNIRQVLHHNRRTSGGVGNDVLDDVPPV